MRIEYLDTPDYKIKKTGLWINGIGHSSSTHLRILNKNPRLLQDYQILYVMKGDHVIECDAGEIILKTNEGFIVSPDFEFKSYPKDIENWENFWIHFDGEIAQSLVGLIPGLKNPGLTPFFGNQIDISILEHMISEFAKKAPWFQTVASSYLHQLLSLLLRRNAIQAPLTSSLKYDANLLQQDNQSILRSVECIHQHFMENMCIQTLANEVGYNRSHFTRQFKQVTGSSPQEYIMRLRFSEAKYLLLTTDQSIQQISFSLNYHNPDSFTKQFKKMVGMTPAEFRKSYG